MSERDYVLGTDEAEIERLGLQHRVWRARMFDAWRRARIGPGHTVLDVGAGPGFASADLAEIVGATGRVIAVERSRRFLDALQQRASALRLANVESRELDLCEDSLGEALADAAWCRWVLSFVADPASVVAKVAAALKPGGVAIFHEYADYATWRTLPPDQDVEHFRSLVMQSWRDGGGEPDVALRLPSWLAASALELIETRPLVEIVGPNDFTWQWPAAFMAVNAQRLHELGYASKEEAERFATALDRLPPGTLMMTPLVAEIIVRKN